MNKNVEVVENFDLSFKKKGVQSSAWIKSYGSQKLAYFWEEGVTNSSYA